MVLWEFIYPVETFIAKNPLRHSEWFKNKTEEICQQSSDLKQHLFYFAAMELF